MAGQRDADEAFKTAFSDVGGHTLLFLTPFNTPRFILFSKINP